MFNTVPAHLNLSAEEEYQLWFGGTFWAAMERALLHGSTLSTDEVESEDDDEEDEDAFPF